MLNQYRVGPIYRAGLIVTGGMCAGLGIAVLVAALARHNLSYAQLLPASVPTPPIAALGFAACGLALVAVGFWFPQVTSVLAMVTLSLIFTLASEKFLATGPRVGGLIATNLGSTWYAVAPNTALVLLLAGAALLMRHRPRWFESQHTVIAILGSVIFAVGVASCVGYMTGVPTYIWQSGAPMSFLSAVSSCILGIGILMSACRYGELDDIGRPRWLPMVVCTGAVAVNMSVFVAYLVHTGQSWRASNIASLVPMVLVSGALSVVAARQSRA